MSCLYAIGNEIPEAGSTSTVGAALGRALAEKVRSLDPTRYIANAVNGMLAVLSDLAEMRQQAGQALDDGAGINTLMTDVGMVMDAVGSSDLVTQRTAEFFGVLDIAGMNYSQSRYSMDRDLFPSRIILGTEAFPPASTATSG